MSRICCYIAAMTLVALSANTLQAEQNYDVLLLPAVESPLATKSMVYSVSRQGDRFFAAGHRGHILYSDDYGDTWTQASVPVRSAILDIHFPTPEQGWAVGHSGVILHSSDGGANWVKQFDGNQLGNEGLGYYQGKAAAEPDSERFANLVYEMEFAVGQGADKPFFAVYFENEKSGYAVGAYGIFFRTDNGGDTWVPHMEVLDLFQYVHLFDIARHDSSLVFAGEVGNLLLKDSETGDYRPQEYPYEGSIFTVLAISETQLFAAGLQGSAYFSSDSGVTWSQSDKPKSGTVNDSILLADGRVLIATDQGKLMVSRDAGASFTLVKSDFRGRISSIIESRPGDLIVSGPFGIRKLSIDAES